MTPFGLNIQSIIPLPGCTQALSLPDVNIRYGPVPDTLPEATVIKARTQECRGKFLLTLEHVANYLVENGTTITIDRYAKTTDDEIRLFLMSSVWAVLLLQRGLLPFHGCGIKTEQGAVVITGPSGNGKSTLAAALMKEGFPLISDEICAVGMDGRPVVLPGFPQILLWQDVLEKLDIDFYAFSRVRPTLLKYIVPLENHMTRRVSDPVPLKKIYAISANGDAPLAVAPLTGMKKIQALIDATYRVHHVEGQELKKDHFRQCSEILPYVDVIKVTRPSTEFDLKKLVRVITEDWSHEQD